MNKNFIGVYPNILPPEHCERIIKEFEDNLKYDAAIDLKRLHGGAQHRSGTSLFICVNDGWNAVSYTHLRAHET